MSEPQIELRPAQPYLRIRERLTKGVPEFADRVFPELFGWLGQHGVQPAGPPFIRVRETDADGEPLDLEVGVPVAADDAAVANGDDRVRADSTPAGRYLTVVHVGPYRSETTTDLADARRELTSWAEDSKLAYSRATERGIEFSCALEQFRIGPTEEPDFTKWETEFAYLLI
jgi:effector-binding domain-containing protein